MTQALCTSISQENTFDIGWTTFLSEQHHPSPELIPLCGHKGYHTWDSRCCFVKACLFPTSSKQRIAHSGWQERENELRNSLNVDESN